MKIILFLHPIILSERYSTAPEYINRINGLIREISLWDEPWGQMKNKWVIFLIKDIVNNKLYLKMT